MSSINTIMNHSDDQPVQEPPISKEVESGEKHSYSCKRCRKLKKKCTRSLPECLNCRKANDVCEYVPRAPRRKKLEILRTFNKLRSKPDVEQFPTHIEQNHLGGMIPLVNGHQKLHIQSVPLPQQPRQPVEGRGNYVYGEAIPIQEQYYVQQQQQQLHQPQNIGMLDFRALPPIISLGEQKTPMHPQQYTSILNRVYAQPQPQHPHPHPHSNAFHSYQIVPAPSHAPQQQQLSTQFQQSENFSDLKTNIIPSYNSISATDYEKKAVISGDYKPTAIQEHLQEGLLKNIIGFCGSNDSVKRKEETYIEIDHNLHCQCVEAFFITFGRYLPFINKKKHFARFQTVEFSTIDKLHPRYSFDLYMICYLGYCVLERQNKITGDYKLKQFLIKKSIGNATNAITYDDLNSIKYLLLLAIYTIFDNAGAGTWHLSGILVRAVLNLSLNRQRSSTHGKSEKEIEMEHRLFWSVYNFDRWISLALARSNMLDDDDINIPYPKPLPDEDPFEMASFCVLISLRKLEGQIVKQLHSANSAENFPTIESKSQIIDSFRAKIEEWYKCADNVLSEHETSLSHYLVNWYTMCYNQLLIAVYSPSFVIPDPPNESLEIVSKNCFQFIHNCSIIHQLHLLPLNWVQLYKYMHACVPLLYCLFHGCSDLQKSQQELTLMIEILDSYDEFWPLATELKDIFIKVNTAIASIKDKKALTSRIYDLANQFHEALQSSDLRVGFGHPINSQFVN